ncbi:hypothetical protein NPIL_664611 [Nephila pilipes]|uniref:Uncharacterized protein n=1 Tax=Nephila pilipes TaxID=299642 RepID=A0A8X6MXW4_NEPPI|nr:hypothetical protein NPIL_664611 [Nephila pilipes]
MLLIGSVEEYYSPITQSSSSISTVRQLVVPTLQRTSANFDHCSGFLASIGVVVLNHPLKSLDLCPVTIYCSHIGAAPKWDHFLWLSKHSSDYDGLFDALFIADFQKCFGENYNRFKKSVESSEDYFEYT